MKSLSLTKPHMIVMVGIPGSGKTFFAEKFTETFHAPLVSYEKLRAYAEKNATELCRYQIGELFKTHQSIVLDGGAQTRSERMELAKEAREAGYETLFVWVQTDPTTAKSRVTHAKTGAYSADSYEQEFKRFVAPLAIEKPLVISGKHTYATQVRTVLKKLASTRAEISHQSPAPARPASPPRRNITIR